MFLRDTLSVIDGVLHIGGCSASSLAERYGTPLYVLDEEHIRRMCRAYMQATSDGGVQKVLYASKAYCAKGIYKIMAEEGLGADVVSGGELYTALAGGMSAGNIYFHGNNKTPQELSYALESGVHCIVVDSLDEITLLDGLSEKAGRRQKVLVRVNPGVEAHTHHYIQTARTDSKFGFSVASGEAAQAVALAAGCKNLDYAGIHCHIGSQIFDFKPFEIALGVLLDFIVSLHKDLGVWASELNLGGGFGVYYAGGDLKRTAGGYAELVARLSEALTDAAQKRGMPRPALVLEPGRAIVAEAGVTLYTVGSIKEIKGVKKYIAVDGGMFENPRYSLYQAKYTAALAARMDEPAQETVTIAGKCCESGDILIEEARLPAAKRGDVLAVFSTGAYNYSMASNYNRNLVPPTVICKGGKSGYLVRPQTYEDIARNDADDIVLE